MDDSTQPCRTCADVLPLSAFSIRRETGRPNGECRRCVVDRVARWKRANPDRTRATARDGHRRRRDDPMYRRHEADRDNERRRADPADLWTKFGCERCGLTEEYQRGAGRRRTVCQQCREADWAWKLYGLTSVTLSEFYEKHGNVCGICGGTDSPSQWGNRLHIDHDHATGALRGLLCHGCNVGLGSFADDPDRLEAAAKYLRSHRG